MRRILVIACLASALSGCVAVPAYLERPADPGAQALRVGYQPVAADTKTYRPVGPKGWEELNRRVTPK